MFGRAFARKGFIQLTSEFQQIGMRDGGVIEATAAHIRGIALDEILRGILCANPCFSVLHFA